MSIEAESGLLGGGATIQALTAPPSNSFSSPMLEASGHAYVQLNATGQSVTLTNNTGQNITALNVRYSIPDASSGGGITATLDLYVDGIFRQAITLNSTQTWCYETSGGQDSANQNPATGQPHIFYDETHFFLTGPAVAPGSRITFQQDAANTAAFYWLDVVDMEAPPPPLTQPANSLSIISYGAVSNNPAVDNTAAIQNCFNAAQTQGKIAWIPPGIYYLNTPPASLSANGITIQGAGMWYSVIYANPALPSTGTLKNILLPTSCTVQDVAFDSNGRSNQNSDGNGGGLNIKGNNWVINRVWIQHEGAGIWAAGSHGLVANCRTGCTWGDGININNGSSNGNYLTVSNCFVRGSGDDGIAINSQSPNNTGVMINPIVVNNTTVAPWWANNIGIYGGTNLFVSNNLCMDSVGSDGLGIGSFGTSGDPVLSGTVVNNVLLRCGSFGFYNQGGNPAMFVGGTRPIANIFVAGNTISNAVFAGMFIDLCASNVTVQYNSIIAPGQDGVDADATATGSAIIYSNAVTGLNAGKFAFTNKSGIFVPVTPNAAASYGSMSGVVTEPCSEGGQDVTGIDPGDWIAFSGVNLAGISTFVARAAAAGSGGSIEIHLDAPAGTLVGTCPVVNTGGSQFYANAYCKVNGVSGIHTVYLVGRGSGGSLFNVEYIGFYAAPPGFTHQLAPGNIYSFQSLANGMFVTAPNNGASSLIASGGSVGTAQQFKIIDAGGGNIGLEAMINSNIVTAENAGASPLIANRTSVGPWETFTEVDAGNGNIGLLARINNKYVTATNNGTGPLIASSTSVSTNESFTVGFVSGVPPATPLGLTATPGNSQAILSWMASLGATGYNLKVSTTNGGPYMVVGTNLPGVSYMSVGLTNGITYYFVVSALNPAGESTNSLPVSATPGVLDRSGWVATSSTSGSDSPANALDGNLTTRWSTDAFQASGQWFMVDMGMTNVFNQLVLNAVNSPSDYPRSYQVTLSNDGINWGSSVAGGAGSPSVTTITFASQAARYIRITQTGNAPANYWSIDEFNVYAAPPLAPANLTATNVSSTQVNLAWNASVSASGYNLKRSTAIGGPYATVATNLPYLNYADAGLVSGTVYYYIVSAINNYGEGSSSVAVAVRPVSLTQPMLNPVIGGGQIQLGWPQDHTGWSLQMQTNSLGAGLGINWTTVPASNNTNQMTFPIIPTNGGVFFRLVYP